MRRRPALKVYIAPSPAHPGDTLRVTAVLKSPSETPVRDVTFSLRCEQRTSIPEGRAANVFTRDHFSLVARHDATVLSPGEHRYDAAFPLPTTTPISYESDRSRIALLLEVRVAIPWWLDRVGRYVIEVTPGRVAGVSARPGVFASTRDGPQGKSLYAECSLDSSLLEPGGVVRGSVSFSNLRSSRIERVTAALVLSETQHPDGEYRTWVQGRYEFVLHEGEVIEGESIPFGLFLPSSLPLTSHSALVDASWRLEIGVEGGWNSSTLLSIPVVLLPSGSLPPGELRPVPPAVGRARRRQLWAPAALRAGLLYQPDVDAMRGTFGAVTLSLAVEQRVRDGLFTVATLTWDSLRIALDVGPSHWSDRFSEKEINVGDAPFDARFRIRGRTPEQVRALLDARVRNAIPKSAEVRIHDEGATLSFPGLLSDPYAIESVAQSSAAMAQELARTIATLPVPPSTARFAEAWRAFAARTRGRWFPGACAVFDASFGVDRFDLTTQLSDTGALVDVTLRLHLDPPLAAAPDESAISSATAIITAHRSDASLHATTDGMFVTLREAPADDAALDALLDAAGRAGRKLLGRSEAAPYR